MKRGEIITDTRNKYGNKRPLWIIMCWHIKLEEMNKFLETHIETHNLSRLNWEEIEHLNKANKETEFKKPHNGENPRTWWFHQWSLPNI